MKYLIYTDVSADIDLSCVNTAPLRFIPMEYSLGGVMKTCSGPESRETLKKFYDGQRDGDLTKTSQISPYLYKEYLTPAFEEGYSVLYLCLSGGLSSTYQSSLVAKAELEEEFPGQYLLPVDTLAATGGMGVLLERALKNHEQGLTLEENAASVQEAVSRLHHWFLVQDLMYLKRGGRISAATAVLGTALNITPILKIDEEGKLQNYTKKRGLKMAGKTLLSEFFAHYDPAGTDAIYVIDADAPELGDSLAQSILETYPDALVRRCELCPIIGAHTGPGMAAICHLGKDSYR